MSSLRIRLRWLAFVAALFAVIQFILVLALHNYEQLNLVYTQIKVPNEHVRIRDIFIWRDFITHTPTRPLSQYNYNQRRSDKLGGLRALPDTRDEACTSRNYSLPAARRAAVSVVICYHNEARSALLRTVVSLIHRTPAHYLHEIILIDDCSADLQLLGAFKTLAYDLYGNSSLHFVTHRNKRRLGLIASRNHGARLATGDFLFFLDSHCEVNVGWLEPLLERLARSSDQRVAVSPMLDAIDAATLAYRPTAKKLMGGFDWNLHFHWLPHDKATPLWLPFASPVFAGGIFLISRNWFFKLNAFNALLEIWGGESIEFSIKLWLCGGQIEIVPCSRIGHIFRKEHAFHFPNKDSSNTDLVFYNSGQATYLRNSKIIAESWLDAYKDLFYASKPDARRIAVNISHAELAVFKRTLRCRPFDWYLQQVFPQLKLPNDEFNAFGPLRNEELSCLQVSNDHQRQQHHRGHHQRLLLHMSSCYRGDVTHWYLQRVHGQLQTRWKAGRLDSESTLCLRVARQDEEVADFPYRRHYSNRTNAYALQLAPCSSDGEIGFEAERWLRLGPQLVHTATHLCLDNPVKNIVTVSQCRHGAPSQFFHFTREVQQQ